MPELLNKPVKQNPAVLAMMGTADKKEPVKREKAEKPTKQKVDYKQKNPRGYIRNRGRNGAKPMSYYIPEDIINLLNLKAARDGKTKSELVVEGLKYVLREEIKEEKAKKKEK